MEAAELLIIAVGVSMDAFAVSICKGLAVRRLRPKHAAMTALWFGGFQALMPLIGFYLGVSFSDFVSSVDHWIAFILLGLIGANMLKEALEKDCGCLRAEVRSVVFGFVRRTEQYCAGSKFKSAV